MKHKNIILTVLFALILCGFSLCSLLLPDTAVSKSERRPLVQFMGYTQAKEQAKGSYGLQNYFSYLEDYLLDQFPGRDTFRGVKAVIKTDLLRQKDSNGYYRYEGGLFKTDATLSDKAVEDALRRFTSLYERYFADSAAKAYYCVVPDKNYFAEGHLKYDYEQLFATVDGALGVNMTKLDALPYLTLEDYYRTDPHWSQDKITDLAAALLQGMNAPVGAQSFRPSSLAPFRGTYSGQAALPVAADALVYLENDATDNATVYSYESESTLFVYTPSNFENPDPYDVYLGGAQALLRIDNPTQSNGRQLVLFRDSFGSSMAPLLLEGYSSVYVVDIRYVSPMALNAFVEFQDDCDVLFLYSTSVMNSLGAFMS